MPKNGRPHTKVDHICFPHCITYPSSSTIFFKNSWAGVSVVFLPFLHFHIENVSAELMKPLLILPITHNGHRKTIFFLSEAHHTSLFFSYILVILKWTHTSHHTTDYRYLMSRIDETPPNFKPSPHW